MKKISGGNSQMKSCNQSFKTVPIVKRRGEGTPPYGNIYLHV